MRIYGGELGLDDATLASRHGRLHPPSAAADVKVRASGHGRARGDACSRLQRRSCASPRASARTLALSRRRARPGELGLRESLNIGKRMLTPTRRATPAGV
jgi:hypothetical protein